MLLDVTGILFAAQLVILLGLGPYADYGNWRPYIMMCELRSPAGIIPLVYLSSISYHTASARGSS